MAKTLGFINASAGTPAYDAATLRMIDSLALTAAGSSPLDSRPGVRPSSAEGFKVTLTGSDYSVSPGYAVLSKASVGAVGSYRAGMDTAHTGTLTAAHATNPRKDILVLRGYDHDVDASGLRKAEVEYITGVAAASPVAPATPTNALLLGTVTVPQSGGGSPTVVDERVFAVSSGGLTPVASVAAYPTTPHKGQAVYNIATGLVEIYDGSAWAVQNRAHKARASRATAQTVASGTPATLDVTATDYANGLTVDLTANTITCQRAGVYRLTTGFQWASSATGRRGGFVYRNGVELARLIVAVAAGSGQTISWEGALAVGDVLRVDVFHDAGTNLDVTAGSGFFAVSEVL